VRLRLFLLYAFFFNQALASGSFTQDCKKLLVLSGVVVNFEVGGLTENAFPTRDISSQITETQNISESIFLRTADPDHLPEVGQFVYKPIIDEGYLKFKIIGKNDDGTYRIFNYEKNYLYESVSIFSFSGSDHSNDLIKKNQSILKEHQATLKERQARIKHDREFLYADQYAVSVEVKSPEQKKADDISDLVGSRISRIQDKIFGMHEVYSNRKEEAEAVQFKFLHIIEKLNNLKQTYVGEEIVKEARKKDPAAYPDVTRIEGLYTHVPDLIPPETQTGDVGYSFEDLKSWVDRFYDNIDENFKVKVKRISEFDKKSDQISGKVYEAKKTLIAKYDQVLKHEKSIRVFDNYNELKKRFENVFSQVNEASPSKSFFASFIEKINIPLLKKLKNSESKKNLEGTDYASVIEDRVESPLESNPYDFYTLIHFMRQDSRYSKDTISKLEKMVDEYKRRYDESPLHLIRSLKADYQLLRYRGYFPRESRQKLLEKIATDSYSKEEGVFMHEVSDSLKSIGRINEYWKGLSLDNLSRESQERGENYKNFRITESPGYSELGVSPERHRHIQRHFQEEALSELEPFYYKLKTQVDLGKLTPDEAASEFQSKLNERLKKNIEYFKVTTGKEKHTVFPVHISSRDVFEALGKNKSFVEWYKNPKPSGSEGFQLSRPKENVYAWDGWITIKGQLYNVIILAQRYHEYRTDKVGFITLYPLSGPGVVSF
jgi:hypothetical protein